MFDQLLQIDTSFIDNDYFKPLLALLFACLLIIPLLERLRISPVLGYLLAGLAVGPSGFDLVEHSEGLEDLADLGVVFLLFIIGLNISAGHFEELRLRFLQIGLPQVAICGGIVAAAASFWDHQASVTILLGLGFALSSTAIVSQYLLDAHALHTPKGRLAMAVLLAQDFAVVPLLVMVKVFADAGDTDLPTLMAVTTVKAIIAITIVALMGRYALRPLHKTLHETTRTPEITVGLSLLAIFAAAAITSMAGLSVELGAFLAGLMLAESTFQKNIQRDIKPFQGLLLGLFFITVGMQIDLQEVLESLGWLAASVVGLLCIKVAAITGLCRLWSVPMSAALPAALLLGQSSEFVFVIIGLAMATGLMPVAVGQFMLLVTALSMLATPAYIWLSDRAEKKLS